MHNLLACLAVSLQVPVGITTYATFHIKNQGYDNLELATRLPADTSRLPLTLEFPEGNLIGECWICSLLAAAQVQIAHPGVVTLEQQLQHPAGNRNAAHQAGVCASLSCSQCMAPRVIVSKSGYRGCDQLPGMHRQRCQAPKQTLIELNTEWTYSTPPCNHTCRPSQGDAAGDGQLLLHAPHQLLCSAGVPG